MRLNMAALVAFVRGVARRVRVILPERGLPTGVANNYPRGAGAVRLMGGCSQGVAGNFHDWGNLMMSATDVPAELIVTSMRLREQAEAAAESPVERLLRAVDTHATAETEALGQYEYLAEESGDPVIAMVMRLILDDEVRHHGLLHRMATTLRDALEWTSSPAALPKDVPQKGLPQAYAKLAHSLIEEERTGARALRRLAGQEKDINGGLESLLLEMMAMDSDKHARLLQFVAQRLEARASA
jgi:rubrerythrin